VDLTFVHPNPANGRTLRGSAATFFNNNGEQKNRESAASCGRTGVDVSPMVFDTWGGLHGAWKDVVRAIFAQCTASLLPGARPRGGRCPEARPLRATGPLRGQLEALITVATETPTWWAAVLPAAPTFTAAGNPQW